MLLLSLLIIFSSSVIIDVLDITRFVSAGRMSNLPERIGNYILEREIGRGATSEVWLARHAYLEQRQVAVKILMAQDREMIQRFNREANLISRLRHPHIVQILDYGYYAPFYCTVMEYVHGGSLGQLLERQRCLPLQEALQIFKQIASALDYAHQMNIVHRDVSPGNVLLEQATGRVLLTDFGIARELKHAITVPSSIMGTPGYWSPEHAHSAASVTHLSDIYSLGVVLYVMLSGDLPWDEVPGLPDRAFEPPLPLKQRGVTNLPPDIDRVIQIMLANDPARRFPTAQAAVEELERIFARHQIPTQVMPPEEAPDVRYPLHIDDTQQQAIEAALGPDLIRTPLTDAERRALALRQPGVIAALLDTWSAQGWLRRAWLGRLARIHKVSSQNIYFYHLEVLYERRSPPVDLEEPDYDAREFPLEPERDRWQVILPPPQEFKPDAGGQVVLPGSARVISCSACGGKGKLVCKRCKGKQRVYVTRPVEVPPVEPASRQSGQQAAAITSATNPAVAMTSTTAVPRTERVLVPCPECAGHGGFTCERCQGTGRLVQRRVFTWQRRPANWFDHDELLEVDGQWLLDTCEMKEIYRERVSAACRPEWLQVPILADMVQEAQKGTDANTRIVLSEVAIGFIPISRVLFDLGQTPEEPQEADLYHLTIYGFEHIIPPDWRFLNWERVIFICLTGFLLILVALFGFFAFTR